MAHDISDEQEPTFSAGNSTSSKLFCRQLNFLRERFRFVALHELLSSSDPLPLAALTFDDGFRTVLTRAEKILSKINVPFTVFCNGQAIRKGFLDYGPDYPALPFAKAKFYLNAAEVNELHRGGAGIGSHGSSHASLGATSDEQLPREILDNKEFLENLVGAAIPDFAFPFGKSQHITQAAIEHCRAAGHLHLFSAQPGYASQLGKTPTDNVNPRASLHLQTEQELHLLLNRIALKRLVSG